MYDVRPNLVIGFHGCDSAVAQNLLTNSTAMQKSRKPYDWLGHGMYFWENNIDRAWEWAIDKERRGEIREASVIGAVLYLGNCLDFLDSKYLNILHQYFGFMKTNYDAMETQLPENRNTIGDTHNDKLIRELDCAVIELCTNRYSPTILRKSR